MNQEWQTIETAPLDGTEVILNWPFWSDTACTGYYSVLDKWESMVCLGQYKEGPVQWMPLPKISTNPVDVIEELIPKMYPGWEANKASFDFAREALDKEYLVSTTSFEDISIADIVERLNEFNIEDLRDIPAQMFNHKTEEWETITGFMIDVAKLKFYSVSNEFMKKYKKSSKLENTSHES